MVLSPVDVMGVVVVVVVVVGLHFMHGVVWCIYTYIHTYQLSMEIISSAAFSNLPGVRGLIITYIVIRNVPLAIKLRIDILNGGFDCPAPHCVDLKPQSSRIN